MVNWEERHQHQERQSNGDNVAADHSNVDNDDDFALTLKTVEKFLFRIFNQIKRFWKILTQFDAKIKIVF